MRGGVFALLHRRLRIEKPHKGGILIEFAFSIPVCIALLFFVNDHYRFYELKSKVKTSTYLAASMLQQITNNKADKQLTQNDLARVSYASCLNLFHTNTMFDPWPLDIYYDIDYVYVKRISSDSYEIQVGWGSTSQGSSPNDMSKNFGNVTTTTLAGVQAYHSDLACSRDGDERLLLKCYYRKKKIGTFNKSKLGFLIINSKTTTDPNSGTSNNLFKYYLVITPKPGLFPGRNE